MDTEQLTDDQLIACFKQCTRIMAVRSRQADALREEVVRAGDLREEYTIELIKRGYQVTVPL